jgi:CubicO group peptidase (beta-lactamase class C family)
MIDHLKSTIIISALLMSLSTLCQNAFPQTENRIYQNSQSKTPLIGPTGIIGFSKNNNIKINADAVDQLMNDISSGKWINVHGLIIIKDGRLVAEGYWNGSHVSKLHDIRSASKSVASILVGIAVHKEYISSADARLYDFFPEYRPFFPDTVALNLREQWLNDLTIEHLLNMTSGFEYDDWYESFRGEIEIQKSRNWVQKAATSGLIRQPGTFYAYNTASLVLLSEVIARTSGLSMKKFAETMFFSPLDINKWKWYSRKGVIYMGGILRLTLRDMAKIGLLMLNDGVWNDQRLLSQEWIDAITRELNDDELSWQRHGFHHHYLWWQFHEQIKGTPVRAYYASGNGGQTIMFIPGLEMVIAITTGNYNTSLEPQSVQIIREVILPAVIPETEKDETY